MTLFSNYFESDRCNPAVSLTGAVHSSERMRLPFATESGQIYFQVGGPAPRARAAQANFVKISSKFSQFFAFNIAFFSIFQNLHISVKFCQKFCKILQNFCGFLKILQILQNLPKNVKNFAIFSNFLAEISRICSREGDFLLDFEKC